MSRSAGRCISRRERWSSWQPEGWARRAALRFAELYGDEFDGGVWFCDLSAAQTLEGLLREVARALGLALVGASVEPQIEQIGFALAGREEALFLFDNVEQVARELLRCCRIGSSRRQKPAT